MLEGTRLSAAKDEKTGALTIRRNAAMNREHAPQTTSGEEPNQSGTAPAPTKAQSEQSGDEDLNFTNSFNTGNNSLFFGTKNQNL